MPMARLLPKIRDQILANHRAGERICGGAVRRGVMCSLVRPGRALRRGRGQPRPVEIQADRGGRIHAHGVGGKRHVGAGAKLSCSKYALDR